MTEQDVASVLKELGHPYRIKLFKRLTKAGFDGLPVGVLREELDIPHSTMTHHIASLVRAGLIEQKREGRTLRCVPQFGRLWDVIAFLQSECCLDEPGIAQPS